MAEIEAAATIPDAAVVIIKSLLLIFCFSLSLRASFKMAQACFAPLVFPSRLCVKDFGFTQRREAKTSGAKIRVVHLP
jgi:hypothetical protein